MAVLRPINNKIIVKREEQDETKNGIYLPTNSHKKKCRGEVLAVGSGILLPNGTREPLSVKPGDVVSFQPGVGTEITHEGEKYLIVEEKDLLLVIEEA